LFEKIPSGNPGSHNKKLVCRSRPPSHPGAIFDAVARHLVEHGLEELPPLRTRVVKLVPATPGDDSLFVERSQKCGTTKCRMIKSWAEKMSIDKMPMTKKLSKQSKDTLSNDKLSIAKLLNEIVKWQNVEWLKIK
jgi:hypothetical protein